MSTVSRLLGERIRTYRKMQGITLQELADKIHKSRATVSKYENGEIVLDIQTLYDISRALHLSLSRLSDIRPEPVTASEEEVARLHNQSPFFRARRLYFYYYDGRARRLKDGVIDIQEDVEQPGRYEASLTLASLSESGRSSDTYYAGTVTYSDMLIRFSFINQFNSLEEDLLYIFNPLAATDATNGLICGISSADLMPCAFKCLVTLSPKEPSEELVRSILITKQEWQRCQKLNMLAVNLRQ